MKDGTKLAAGALAIGVVTGIAAGGVVIATDAGAASVGYGQSVLVALGVVSAPVSWPLVFGVGVAAGGIASGAYLFVEHHRRKRRRDKALASSYDRVPPIHGY